MQLTRRKLLGATGVVLGGGSVAVVGASESGTLGDGDDDDEENVDPSEVALDESEARATATDRVDGTVREVELEREDGVPVYEVEIAASDGTVHEVVVHADEGTVLEVEREDDDEDEDDEDEEANDEDEDETDDDDSDTA